MSTIVTVKSLQSFEFKGGKTFVDEQRQACPPQITVAASSLACALGVNNEFHPDAQLRFMRKLLEDIDWCGPYMSNESWFYHSKSGRLHKFDDNPACSSNPLGIRHVYATFVSRASACGSIAEYEQLILDIRGSFYDTSNNPKLAEMKENLHEAVFTLASDPSYQVYELIDVLQRQSRDVKDGERHILCRTAQLLHWLCTCENRLLTKAKFAYGDRCELEWIRIWNRAYRDPEDQVTGKWSTEQIRLTESVALSGRVDAKRHHTIYEIKGRTRGLTQGPARQCDILQVHAYMHMHQQVQGVIIEVARLDERNMFHRELETHFSPELWKRVISSLDRLASFITEMRDSRWLRHSFSANKASVQSRMLKDIVGFEWPSSASACKRKFRMSDN
jgi:hypothetical protein